MKPLEIITRLEGTAFETREVIDRDATLQAIIDRVNELSKQKKVISGNVTLTTHLPYMPGMNTTDGIKITPGVITKEFDTSPKRFTAEDIDYTWIDYGEGWGTDALTFKSKAEAQAALEALLNL